MHLLIGVGCLVLALYLLLLFSVVCIGWKNHLVGSCHVVKMIKPREFVCLFFWFLPFHTIVTSSPHRLTNTPTHQILTRACVDPADVPHRMQEIHQALLLEQQEHTQSWCDFLRQPDPALRQMLLVGGVGINFFQQAVGIEAAVYYTPTTFAHAGITIVHHQHY